MKWSKPKKQRIKKSQKNRINNKLIKRRFFIEVSGMWFDTYDNCWVKYEERNPYHQLSSNCNRSCSLKSAIRRIKKWDMPIGTKFMVFTPYIGHQVEITKTK